VARAVLMAWASMRPAPVAEATLPRRSRAPSTLGTHLRAFTHGHVQQLDQVGARVLAGLADQVPGLITGAEKADGIAFLDVDARSVRSTATPSKAPPAATRRCAG